MNITIKNKEEAKAKISEEFINRFYEWLDDEKNLPDYEYGKKYGWSKSKELHKDNLKAVEAFQKYIFCAFWMVDRWESFGYDRHVIWELTNDKFLSEQIRKWKTYYYISQRIAKQIYREHKAK